MKRRFSSSISSSIAVIAAGLCFAQSTSTVTLTFEGLQDQEEILNYYNGGLGSFGSGPGPNYGITFGSGAQAIVSQGAGGSGNFSGNPSGNTIAFFLSGGALTMNVANGFSTGFSFYYASVMNPGVITVYDGLNGTGNLLATLNLPTTGDRCNGSIFDYSCWVAKGVTFTGVAKSVNFGGTADDIGFDNITLGSQIPNNLTISTTSLPNGTTGVAYASTTLQASGGKTPYVWSATGLPTGLSVSSSTGVLSGTPTQSGTFSVVVTVTDASSPVLKATQTYSITIVGGVSITTTSLPAGTPNVAYPSTTLTAQGGRPPLTWSSTGLPPGMTLSSGGVLSGTPTQGGTFSVVVTVKDSSTPQSTATQTYSLVVGVATPPVTITTTTLPAGTAGSPYPSTTLQAQGGTPPYSWSAAGLPAGLTLSTAGVLTGTPTASGSFNVTLTVTDSAKQTVTSSPIAMTVAVASLKLSCTAPTGAVNAGSSYSASCTASGGTPAYTYSAANLPSWLTQTAGSTTISFSGTVPNPPPATYSFTVSASDSSTTKQTASATVSITVTVPPVQGITISGGGGVPNQTTLSVTFPQAAPTTYTGTLTLSFAHDPTVTNVPASYIDPAAGFPVSGQSSVLTQNFTVNQGQTQAAIQFGLGTVAGTWTVTLTALNTSGVSVLPTPAPTYTVPIAPGAPAISAGTVKIVNRSSSGFSIQLTGFATTRDVASATFAFSAAAGAQLQGTSVTVPFNGQDQSQWFNTTAGQNAGGTFSLVLPFGYSGDPNALGSVTVTLTNAKGQASTPVNGS